MHLFPIFLTNFVDWNVQMGQKGEKALSSRLFRRGYYSVLIITVNWNVSKGNKEKSGCPIVFYGN